MVSKYSNYPNGFPNGVLIQGEPVQKPNPGQVYWVNSTTVVPPGGKGSSNGNKGTYLAPFATIDYAIGQCTAGRGDTIYVMPGHVETIGAAAAVDLDVDGVSIIGLGRGTDQARFDFTATAGTVEVNADNCAIVNMNFHANVSGVVIGLSVLTGATDLLVADCVFDVETTTTDEFVISANLGVGCDRTVFDSCKMDMGLGGAAAGIKLVGASDHVQIKNSEFQGDYSLAIISGITTLSTNVLIENNLLLQGTTGGLNAVAVIVLLTGTTGIIRNNDIVCDVATFALQTVADTCSFLGNQRTDDISEAKTSNDTSASVTVSTDA
jgi:hypothetical protein